MAANPPLVADVVIVGTAEVEKAPWTSPMRAKMQEMDSSKQQENPMKFRFACLPLPLEEDGRDLW